MSIKQVCNTQPISIVRIIQYYISFENIDFQRRKEKEVYRFIK